MLLELIGLKTAQTINTGELTTPKEIGDFILACYMVEGITPVKVTILGGDPNVSFYDRAGVWIGQVSVAGTHPTDPELKTAEQLFPKLRDYMVGVLKKHADKALEEKREFVLDPTDLLSYCTRYNGGWTKSITGLDKSKCNGYSLLGSFKRRGKDKYKVGELYLDCDIRGSRKNRTKYYILFTPVIGADGKPELKELAESDGRDWAVDLWDAIDAFWEAQGSRPNSAPTAKNKNPLQGFSDEALMAELERRGYVVGGKKVA